MRISENFTEADDKLGWEKITIGSKISRPQFYGVKKDQIQTFEGASNHNWPGE